MGGVLAVAVLRTFVAQAQQPIEPIRPQVEQEIEILRPGRDQTVSDVDVQGEQELGVPEKTSRGARAASTVGKVVLGVVAAGVALGAMAASLLLL